MHECGTHCGAVRQLQMLAWTKAASIRRGGIIAVKSWCRICGIPVLLEVLDDYDDAVRHFNVLDDTPMNHKNQHAERGGWGVNWRLDDVLTTVFPRLHNEEMWPKSIWWNENHGEPLAEDQAVLVLSGEEMSVYQDRYMDIELRMLERKINSDPCDREELLDRVGDEVWSAGEVGATFDIIGFKSPFAIAEHRESGVRGSLLFQNSPRYYFSWDPHRVI